MTIGRYEFPGGALRVDLDEAPVLEWLTEFLAPSFCIPRDVGTAAPDVRLAIDPDHFEALQKCGPAPSGHRVDCFRLDHGLVQLPAWQDHDGDTTVFDEKLGVFYCRRGDGTIRVVAPADSGRVRVAVMRVVRELTMSHLAAQGWLIVHAAAFVVDGHAILVIGPKRAGKTTLLTHALTGRGARCLANDRVAVSLEGGRRTAWGIPTIVSLRVSMMPRFPDLVARLATGRYDFRFSRRELREGACAVDVAPAEVWSLTPLQYCELVGTTLREQAPVRAVVFPRVPTDGAAECLEAIDPAMAAKQVADAVFRPHGPDALFVPRAGDGAPPDAALPGRAAAFLADMHAYAYRFGPQAPSDSTWLTLLGR